MKDLSHVPLEFVHAGASNIIRSADLIDILCWETQKKVQICDLSRKNSVQQLISIL